ncbi:MAG TPA: hypothetical protein VF290_22190 [Pyrinomonadaceae bacterium]
MSFAPLFNEIFESYLYDNLMFAIDAEMKNYLDGFYPGQQLPDFAVKMLGFIISPPAYPALAINPIDFDSSESESGDHVENEHRILASLVVSSADASLVTRLLFKYSRAFKAVVRKMSRADWLRDIPANAGNPTGAIVTKIKGQYSAIGKNPNKTSNEYIRAIDFQLTIQFVER